jgi:peptidoglycan hydrolase CwlO-like protein
MTIEHIATSIIGLATTLSLFLLNHVFNELKALRQKIDKTRDEYQRRDDADKSNGQIMSLLERVERKVDRIDVKIDNKQDKGK